MATEKDVLEIFKLLKANYPRFDVEDPAALLDSWTQRFAAVEAAVLRQAAELHMDHSKWFPSRAELLELIEEAGRLVGKGEQDEAAAAYWEEYWGKVNPLRERRKELEDRFHFDRRLDAGDWEALAAAFDQPADAVLHQVEGSCRCAHFEWACLAQGRCVNIGSEPFRRHREIGQRLRPALQHPAGNKQHRRQHRPKRRTNLPGGEKADAQ